MRRVASVLLLLGIPVFFSFPATAQEFFAPPGIDNAAGLDRGSAQSMSAVTHTTRYFTLDNTGSNDIGPIISSLDLSKPDFVLKGDQLDLVGVIGGSVDPGYQSLTAGGLGYRLKTGGGTTVYTQAGFGYSALGSATSRALDVTGSFQTLAFGLRHDWFRKLDGEYLTGTVELLGRHAGSTVLGRSVIDEQLRVIRGNLQTQRGHWGTIRRRFGVTLAKGLGLFGASPVVNPKASWPGASSRFFKVSFSAEASIPLARRIILNTGVVGQWSDSVVPFSQRCGYGTHAYSQGFDNSYIEGDTCLATRSEIAYEFRLPHPRLGDFNQVQGFAGIDTGLMLDHRTSVQPASSFHWTSLSAGVRMLFGNRIAEVKVTQILNGPGFQPSQQRTRLWLRGAIRF